MSNRFGIETLRVLISLLMYTGLHVPATPAPSTAKEKDRIAGIAEVGAEADEWRKNKAKPVRIVARGQHPR